MYAQHPHQNKVKHRANQQTMIFLRLSLILSNITFGVAFQVITNPIISTNRKSNSSAHISKQLSSHNKYHNRINFINHRRSTNDNQIQLSVSNLPSAYDISLPASLRGEAVRSALRSERGTCLDFTSSSSDYLNVGMVKVTGEGTANFLNSKLTNSFSDEAKSSKVSQEGENTRVAYGRVKEAGLVTSKGRLIDKLTVLSFDTSIDNDKALMESYILTSPGHSGSKLFDRLDPFIFPLDGVKLHDMCPSSSSSATKSNNDTRVFTVVATKLENVQSSIQKNVIPILKKHGFNFGSSATDSDGFVFPGSNNESLRYTATNANTGKAMELLLFEQTYLTPCCCIGYTIVITEQKEEAGGSNTNYSNHNNLASQVWDNMIDANNFDGPVELGPLEYETLRIESGVPAFGYEITGGLNDDEDEDDNVSDNSTNSKKGVKKANASPLELKLDNIVDETKGCYQGQEAIAAQLNNKRGIPRTLYSVIFPEEDNFFDDQKYDEEEYSNHNQRLTNKTTKPIPGADLFVLGSNQKIKVGTLTSVAEKDGTSASETVALALVRRASGILKSMNNLGLDTDFSNNIFEEDPFWSEEYSSKSEDSGIIYPPSLDPLDRLEVVVGDSFTQGYLRPLPHIRLKGDQQLFETDSWNTMENIQEETGSVMGFIPQNESLQENSDIQSFEIDTPEEKKIDEEKVALEAKRKEEKMEMLRKRAEEAMNKRRQKKEEQIDDSSESTPEMDAAVAEAERKEKKMKMLKERAEAAMKKRRQKKNST